MASILVIDDEALFRESTAQALQRRGDFAPAHQSLAQLLALQGKKAQALQHHQEAVRLMQQSGSNSPAR